jgi:alpha-2-macroglobulin
MNNPAGRFLRRALLWALLAAPTFALAQDGGGLKILDITPAGTDVPPGQEIVVQFDRTMVPLGRMGRPSGSLPVTITPALPCQWRWLDTERLACRLPGQERFRPATRYRIRIGTQLAARDGARLAQPENAAFTTETPRIRWAFFHGWRSPVTPVYLLRFTLPVTSATVARALSYTTADGESVPAHPEAFTTPRRGPLLLPVPGVPGAIAWIAHPHPSKTASAAKSGARDVWWVVPSRPLAPDATYQLEVGPGLVTPFGTLPGTEGPVWNTRFTTFGPFELVGISCLNGADAWETVAPLNGTIPGGDSLGPHCRPDSVRLEFSAPVPLATLAAAGWAPTPAPAASLAGLWENYPSWMLTMAGPKGGAATYRFDLPFAFKGMTRFRLRVPAGVTDRFGRKLHAPVTLRFMTGHLPPSVSLGAPGGVLEAGEKTLLPVYFANLDRLDFSYQWVSAATLESGSSAIVSTPVLKSLLTPYHESPPEDRDLAVSLGVRTDLDGRSGALSGVLSWDPPIGNSWHQNSSQPVFAEVTPWEVLAKVGHFDTLVWVVSLSSGAPVAGVRVRFASAPQRSLEGLSAVTDAAVTDANGLAVLPGAVTLGDAWMKRYAPSAPTWYVTAVKGPDMALLPLEWEYLRWIGSVSGGAIWDRELPRYGHLRAWGLTAQGVYRPGATVRYTAFVRGMASDSLTPAPDLPFTFTIRDSTGKSILTQTDARLSAFGGLHGDLYLPKSAAMGWYDMTLSWPAGADTQSRQIGRFLVTEFVPASFQVRTLLEGSVFGPGDPYRAQVWATLHSGGPYTRAPMRTTILVRAAPFAPDNPVAAGFSFDANPADTPASATLSEQTATLDDQGGARAGGRLPQAVPIVYGRLVIQAAVESARGTWVADRAQGIWAARNRFVGLKLDDWLLRAGQPFNVHFLVADPEGRTVAGTPVHVLLQRQKLNVIDTANGTGGFTPQQSETWVDEGHCTAISAHAPGQCRLTPKRAGTYRIVASVADTRGRLEQTTLEAWSVGPGEVLWKTGTHVQLVPDKSTYHVGDVARVLVQNPYPGAKALVTVERYGVLWKQLVTLSGSTPVLSVPIERSFFPGAYLSVGIFSRRVSQPDAADLGRPTLALGYVALPVTGKGSSLSVAVATGRTDYKPRQTVTVHVRVRDAHGQAAPHTRVVAAVVDEAVLDLLEGRSGYYDPRRTFYAPPQGPDMLDYSLVSQLITTVRTPHLGKGETPGGDGGGGLPVRSVFKYTAYWDPVLETDPSGRVTFSFKTPDNLTGWRVIVMALTRGAAMGFGQATVRVNLPVELDPALPNVVRVGDRFDAGFSVTNRTGNGRSIGVHIDATGAAQGAATRTLALRPYARGLAWLDLTARGKGAIHLLATARSGGLGDALSKAIPVRTGGTMSTAASYGSLTHAATNIPIDLPAAALPGSGHVVVELAPTALGNLAPAFRSMSQDPLDTWEVHLSRAVMAADYLELRDALPASVSWPEAAAQIDAALEHAADFQAPDGGMAFLIPRDEFVSPYLSAYTALAFDWLAAAGHPAPAEVRAALDAYLRSHILEVDAESSMPGWPDLQVAAMDALAEEGKPSRDMAAVWIPQLTRLSLFGKALLLQVALAGHDDDSAKRILVDLLARSEQTSGSMSLQETRADAYSSMLASPLRANCAVLDALVSAAQDGGAEAQTVKPLLGRLVRWIDERRGTGGAWPNSQENVFCTTAEAHYAQAFEGPVQALSGHVRAGDRTLGEAKFATRHDTPRSISAAAPSGSAVVSIMHGGQGRLYYGIRLDYSLPALSVGSADAGFSIRRQYKVPDGKDWVSVGPGTMLRRGEIVRVDLTVDVPAERHYVVLTDPLPGAFEAVNHQLATADLTAPQRTPGGTTLWFDYGAWPDYSIATDGFYHREIALDAVRFYADDLRAGHYRLVYAAQVISPGRFLAPPARAREIYQPDVFGRGLAQYVQVAEPRGSPGDLANGIGNTR